MRRLPYAFVLFAGLLSLGCPTQPSTPAVTVATARSENEEDDHDHDRKNMMAAHAGKLHAWLTAHLSSKTGNELDIFFETMDKDPKPAPLPIAKIIAKGKRAGEETEYDLVFEPAPKEERKDDPAGACSHFVAKAPWMKADDVLTVSAPVEIDGKQRKPTWRKFEVKKYAHHVE